MRSEARDFREHDCVAPYCTGAAALIAAAAAADPDWNREARRPPFVTIPLSVTEDMILGTIDVDQSVKQGLADMTNRRKL